jgi:Calcineurin-like phosphoesterase
MIKTKYNRRIILILLQLLICLSCESRHSYFSFIILPDTQYYSFRHPDIFQKQMDWIVKNKKLLNIQYVLHMGDITNENQEFEWKVADSCLKMLENAGIPYSLVYGDNDMKNPERNDHRFDGIRHTELLNKYFPVTRFNKPYSGIKYGYYEPGKIDNSSCQFDYKGSKYLILNLEIAPRNEVMVWADSIIKQNVKRKVIIVTHDFIDAKGNMLDDLKSFGMDGKDDMGNKRGNDANSIFKKLIRDNDNVLMVLCGHKDGELNKTIKLKKSGDSGKKRKVFEILTDYQNKKLDDTEERCGNGLLRILKIYPEKNEIVLSSESALTRSPH